MSTKPSSPCLFTDLLEQAETLHELISQQLLIATDFILRPLRHP
jgi:hypothetical protein